MDRECTATCDDFEGTVTGFTWTKTENGGASVSPGNTRPFQGQRSLQASRPAMTDRGAAWFQSPLGVRPTSCEFEVFVDPTAAQQRVEVFDVGFLPSGPPYTDWHVFVTVGSGGASSRAGDFGNLQAGGTAGKLYGDLPQLTPGAWHHVLVALAWAANTVRVTVDGASPVIGTGIAAPSTGTPYVAVGGPFQGNPDVGWSVFVDNLVCKN